MARDASSIRIACGRRDCLAEPAVLDSSAVLAVFLNEPGGEIVIPILEGAFLAPSIWQKSTLEC